MKVINGERRYNAWAGNPNGNAEDLANCIEGVWSSGRGSMQYQCSRKRGHGPDGLYCVIHAKEHLDQVIGTWYRTDSFGFGIKAVEIYSETKTRIGIKEGNGKIGQTSKHGYYNYWPTREAAIEHLCARLENMRANLAVAEKQFNEAAT